MEAQEEVMGSKDHKQIIKGRRTKRQRPPSPLALNMACSSSSTGGEGFGDGDGGRVCDYSGERDQNTASPNSSVEFTKSTEEEEDMANCLILLAKGQTPKSSEPAKAAAATGQGLYVYQCKTCNRCFSSFQALGGHRASHKKPKAAAVIEEKKVVAFVEEEEEDLFNNSTNTTLSLQIVNRASSCNTKKSNKVHECSVCGAEFLSGQALGGHMRRHRTFVSTPTMATSSADSQEAKKPRNMLSLDLNLPATDDDFRESKFPFSASKEQALVFSPLVDCYY